MIVMNSIMPGDITWFASDPINRKILSSSSLNTLFRYTKDNKQRVPRTNKHYRTNS
jgi:hypothetical protein